MMKTIKHACAGMPLAAWVAAVALTGFAALAGVPALVQAAGSDASSTADPQLVKQGEYMARASDCIACHTDTAKGGKPYAGALGIASPLGMIYSTNITPSKSTGIGNYTLEQFDRAVRGGVARDGHTLYPAMPYTSFARMARGDVRALYAYFMNGVAPVEQANKANGISWPLSMRWPLSIWRWMFAPKPVALDAAPPAADQGQAQLARGQYLVEGPGHCSACHTPRGWALQEKATTDAGGPAFLSGGVIDGWLAKSLRGDAADGLGSWSNAELAAFLKTGRTARSAAFANMAEVVHESTQHMTDADLNAIAAYLKTLTPAKSTGTSQPLAYNPAAAQALRSGADQSDGAITFINNCAACHRSTGKGYAETFPSLALNSVANTSDSRSVIHIILKGAQMPATASAPTQFAMPGFDWRLTDQEVADVATFVRASWGNQAPAVTAAQVAKVRKETGAAAPPVR